jgi:hypothetical protein
MGMAWLASPESVDSRHYETAEVTDGTGRFAPPATGHFELGGQIAFTTIPPSFVLPWQGVISSGGSTQH